MTRPLAIDLYCGLGGWAEGFLAEGYDVIGFDIERHDYGKGGYPGQLVLQDALTLHGSQFRNAACIVASPPCQAYSYRAMPWKRAKTLPPPSNELFDACFRIQREASEAAGHPIPMAVENVKGAQPWVGRAKWHYGSFYLWGDVPALMPFSGRELKNHGRDGKVNGFNFHEHEKTGQPGRSFQSAAVEGTKQMSSLRGFSHPGSNGHNKSDLGGPHDPRRFGSKSTTRKAASAEIAKIPFELARWIAHCFKPAEVNACSA